MPRRRHPPSLRKASIENIVCYFEDFWFAGSTKDLLEYSGRSDVFTPFQHLCDEMVQEIIDMLDKRKLLRPQHFQLLLHSNIRRLNLKGVCQGFTDDSHVIIKTLGIRCQKLTHLNLEGLKNVKPDLMCTLMINLPQIVTLCLNNTWLDGNVIKAISENCPNLLELDVYCCNVEVHDALLYLCNCPDHQTITSRPKLRKLKVHTLTKDTVVRLLKNQPSLQCLGTCAIIDHAFDQMYGEEFQSIKEIPLEKMHNLLDVTINWRYDKDCHLSQADRLDLTFQCCPFLTKLTLFNLREGESLNNVAKLKHLNSLIVVMDTNYDFPAHMAPLLSNIGDNLTFLKCVGFDDVSLILIGKSCPNLESLVLYDGSLIDDEQLIGGDVTQPFLYFTNLKVISINIQGDCHSPTDLDENVLSLLLQNATKLVYLECIYVNNMTDKVICESNRKHGFRRLRQCCFRSCPSITVESVRLLLSPDNPLKSLTVFYCENITRQDFNLVRQEVKLREFDIKMITFC